MPKRLFCILLTLLLLAGALTACSKSDGGGMDLVYPIDTDPLSLDPQTAVGSAAATVLVNCLEGLVRVDDNGTIVNAAAQARTLSADGLVYTFTLRDDAVWYLPRNFAREFGEEFAGAFDTRVTAHDFVFAFRRALDAETRSPDASLLYSLKNARAVHLHGAPADTLGVRAEDDRTLILTLESADADLLRLLAAPIASPCNEAFFNATKGRYGLEARYLLCNGPFYLGRWTTDTSLLLRKNDEYHSADRTAPASVTLRIAPDKDSYAGRLLQGTYCAAPLDADTARALDISGGITLTEYPNITWAFCFNCEDAYLPTALRRALCAGLKHELLDSVIPAGTKAVGLVPPGCVFGDTSYRQSVEDPAGIVYNEARAAVLWQEGLKALGTDSVVLTVLCVEKHETALKELLQNWQRLFGFDLKISVRAVESEELLTALERGEYSLAFAPIKALTPSASEYLRMFLSDSETNLLNYRSETYDSLLQNAGGRSVSDAYRDAEARLLTDAAVYPIYYDSAFFALAKGVAGIYTAAEGGGVYFMSGRVLN